MSAEYFQVTMHDVVSSRVPHGARVHRVSLTPEALTTEMLWLLPCREAWSVWAGPRFVGILAQSRVGWTWSRGTRSATEADLGDRESTLARMARDVEATISETRIQTAIESGKA